MLTKAAIVILGTVIASAVTALPFTSPEVEELIETRLRGPTDVASLAPKGDRLRVMGESCQAPEARATCADIFGTSGEPQTVTYQRRIGESVSVLIRMPIRDARIQK
jgi:hypothetical protein